MDSSRFTEAAGKLLFEAIAEAEGREVMAVGRIDEDGLVCEITVAARGTADAVPALHPYMQKGDVVIHNHPSGDTGPSNADLQVASGLGNQGIGFYITDNRQVSSPTLTPPKEQEKSKEKADSSEGETKVEPTPSKKDSADD